MSAPAVRHSSACAATWRHTRRRSRIRFDGGTLDITTPDVAARLLAEGVPAADLGVVAAELERCIRFISDEGDDVLYVRVHPWTAELASRYMDKLPTLLMTTRGKVTR
ncbi:MAG TPA: hypothetical protein VGF28_27295 [Thermoanaerobaculia bacterium]|jgi:hypothetical protein